MTRIATTLAGSAILAAAILAPPYPAFAHARLIKAAPAAGAHVPTGLKQIRLVFNEAVEPSLSTLELDDASGAAVAAAKAGEACAEETCSLAVPALVPGDYKVKYHVLSADGHVVDGDYAFNIAK